MLFFGLHVHRPRSQTCCSAGQCVYGGCSYPKSRKKWMRSMPAKSAAPIEWTGASPQRCRFVRIIPARTGVFFFWFSSKGDGEDLKGREGTVPRSRSHRYYRGARRTRCRPRPARSPYRRSRSCSKLFYSNAPKVMMVVRSRSLRGGLGRKKGRTVTQVVIGTAVVGQEAHRVFPHHIFRVLRDEICREGTVSHEAQVGVSWVRGGTYRGQWTKATRPYVGIRGSRW
jgi:hypothetical protein